MMETRKTIEEQIQILSEEGNTLFGPAKIVAMRLGKKYPKKHGANMIYKDAIITVNYDTFAPNLSVNHLDRRVLTFHLGKIDSYIRGPWVKHLRELARPLHEVEEAEKIAKEKEAERKRLAKWGLDK